METHGRQQRKRLVLFRPRSPGKLFRFLVVIMTVFLSASPSLSADWDDDFPYADIRQARISLIQGDVMLQRGDDDGWSYASLNLPLRPHDRIWVTEDSRCEIQVSGGTIVRLAEDTSVDLLALETDYVQLDLTYGVATFNARERRRGGVVEVATPGAAIETADSEFRVDVDSRGATVVTVRKGRVDIESLAGPVRLGEGEELQITAGGNARFEVGSAAPRDAWDRWCQQRDRQILGTSGRRHIEIDDPWVGDLDLYGRWATEQTYGTVWFPAVRSGWSPYRNGRWLWVEPWGWTWVSYEPWGWGPYHYGRWVHLHRRGWAWVPGRKPVWIPGNARFIYGASWVAWVPLGYRDHYRYQASTGSGVTLSISNYNVQGAITVVSNVGFLSGSYERHRVKLRGDPLREGGHFAAVVPLKPVRASLYPHAERPVRTGHLPPRHVERTVLYLRTPAQAPRSFSERHRVVQHRSTGIERIPVLQRKVDLDPVPPRGKSVPEIRLRSTVIKKAAQGVRQGVGSGSQRAVEREQRRKPKAGSVRTPPRRGQPDLRQRSKEYGIQRKGAGGRSGPAGAVPPQDPGPVIKKIRK